jgi:hypothetical protein
MKKKSANVSKAEQAEIEAWYHNLDPRDFDDLMSRAVKHPGVKPRPKSSRKVSRKPEIALKPPASK